ncbi:MAG: efflux RND transporter periplasmic adaptor subunit [Bacteroidales bacterium]|jgi:RND family efflux transporter MFP subunit|nr:efflux RND transporter periplasmic adaptor subunit [Bacteroidales bacterium]
MKKKKLYIWSLVGLVILGGGFYWYKKSSSDTTSVRYITEPAKKGTLSSTIVASGSIAVDDQETVDPTISGTIADLSVKVGDTVKKGDYLFSVINDDLDANVAQATASYQQALNNLESAKNQKLSAEAEYRVADKKDDKDDDSYTKRQLTVIENKIALAQGEIVQAQKNLSASATSYRNIISDAGKRKVTSPIDGTIIEVSIKNGDELGSSNNNASESAIIVGDLQTLKAEIPVNEVDITKVAVGQKVSITLDALEGTTFTGEVEKIDAIGVATSGVVNYGVTVKFDKLDERMKPTMSVSAIISVSEKADVITVSSSAIKSGRNGDYVEVLENGAPKRVTVTVGDTNDTSTEITSGVSVGDKIITQTIEVSDSDKETTTSGSSSSNRSSTRGMSGMGIMGGGAPPR